MTAIPDAIVAGMVRFSRSIGALLVVLALAACAGGGTQGGGGGTPPTGPTPPQRTTVEVIPGASTETERIYLQAFAESLGSALTLAIGEASALPQLPFGVTQVGTPLTLESATTVGFDYRRPLLIGLPLPDGLDPTEAAIALLERSSLVAVGENGGVPTPTWVLVPTAWDPEKSHLLTPLYTIDPNGVVAVVVRTAAASPTIVGTGPLTPATAAPVHFDVVCSPDFELPDVAETCTRAHEEDIAGVLAGGYRQLLEFGFKEPRVQQGILVSRVGNLYEVAFDVYIAELRPLSKRDNGVIGQYLVSSGHIWIGLNSAGVTNGVRETARHELVHAAQFAYHPNFYSRANARDALWVLEGQTSISERDFTNLRRAGRKPRVVDVTFTEQNGNFADPRPNYEYQAQDFWFYLARRFGHSDVRYLLPFFEAGFYADTVDAALRAREHLHADHNRPRRPRSGARTERGASSAHERGLPVGQWAQRRRARPQPTPRGRARAR